VSSRRLRQEFPDLRRHYWRAKRLWSGSYFAGSVGLPRSRSCASTSSSRAACADRLYAWPPSPLAWRSAHRWPLW